MKPIFTFFLLLAILFTNGQTPPKGSNIWLFQFENGKLDFSRKVTKDSGYDNQPSFKGNRLYFTSFEERQTDIYYFDLSKREIVPFTQTDEDEYSPTPSPNGQFITTVQVEKDKKQRLWNFPVNNENAQALMVLPDIEPVGYFDWIDQQTIAMFVLGEPNNLILGNIKTFETYQVDSAIGRSIHASTLKRGAFSKGFYYTKAGVEAHTVNFYKKGIITAVVQLPDGVQDFCVSPDGDIITTKHKSIFRYNIKEKTWQEIYNLSLMGVESLSRIAVSPDGKYLAVVVTQKSNQ